MCTPTDRALAIEELETLQHSIQRWRTRLIQAYPTESFMFAFANVMNEMKEVSK